MALVSYSDSEESDDEKQTLNTSKAPPTENARKPDPPQSSESSSSFRSFVDRSNPRKIRVALPDAKPENSTKDEADGPPAKRARVEGGALSGFNSILPPPKKAQQTKTTDAPKGAPRKVFSLKTGATPGFDREAGASFPVAVEQDGGLHRNRSEEKPEKNDTQGSEDRATKEPVVKGNTFLFKPLSVARKPQKKKGPIPPLPKLPSKDTIPVLPTETQTQRKSALKVSLFSLEKPEQTFTITNVTGEEYEPLTYDAIVSRTEDAADEHGADGHEMDQSKGAAESQLTQPAGPASLETIASDLNLSAAEKRQLFGRAGRGGAHQAAMNIVNFNTDEEYAANQALRAAGEQVQHNPVRAIAPGKHSLKQLVNAAANQKDALEEHFASGKRNKKEAGNRYGW